MSTANWHYNKGRLAEALALWRATEPTTAMRNAVDNALMDVIRDPVGWGKADPEVAGIFHGSIKMPDGRTIGILYAIPDAASGEIGVVDIRTGSS